MSAKCRVCHRPLKNAAHIAAGVGPICAQRAARRQVATDGQASQKPAYPAEKLARIERMLLKLVRWLDSQQYNLALAKQRGTPAEQAMFEWRVWWALRWCRRWQDIRQRAERLARAA